MGTKVQLRNFLAGPEWIVGTIVRGPVSYMVKLVDGRHVRRHVDHLRKTEAPITSSDTEAEVLDDCFPIPAPTQTTTPQMEPPRTEPTALCRSTRVRNAPYRFTYPSSSFLREKECHRLLISDFI